MVEFNGYLTGAAEKHFRKKSRILGRNILLFAAILVLPMIWQIAKWVRSWEVLLWYALALVCSYLLCLIPQRKKVQLSMTPKRIFADEDYIVCVADSYSESKLIGDVKTVRDFGEFYDITFPFGNASEKFVCQKSLLSKGTLEAFEALFEGKIIRQDKP